ncbi:TlpA family protein disulfide reductase [Pedobacter cryoconitis]|uniref:Redoxin domain-containing protein n=1 Tax=Pedobacter cryoconitis TaxID=188932 RepID=A0A7X0MIN8_9SPHI|nr:TlpA disulfide reductase family protein [Pedobacter cryoconitis]MBB6500597.1 hypothetical protein [Pedobacter cryoconitis]
MKLITTIRTLLLTFLLVGLNYYSASSSYNIDYAEIRINTPLDLVDKIYLSTNEPINNGEEKILYSGIPKKNNEIIRIKCSSPSIIYITCKSSIYPIYIDKGSKTSVTITYKGNKPVFNYGGSYSNVNKYLAEKKDKLDILTPMDIKDIYSMSPEKFGSFNELISSEITALRKKYSFSSTVDNRFKEYDSADISSLLFIRKVNYPDYHYYFTKEKNPALYHFSNLPEDISINNQYGLLSKNYVDLLSRYTSSLIKRSTAAKEMSIKEEQLNFFNEKFLLSTTLFKDKEVAQFLTTQILLGLLDLGFDSAFNEKVKIAQTTFQNTKYLNVATEKYSALKEIGTGKKAPQIDMLDINEKKITLEQFKGKSVFINVWTLACHNSVEELKNINKIADQFKKADNIIFLNLYLDNDINELKKYIKSNPISGTNAILTNNKSDFSNKYFINTVPRYILIDNEGNMITPFEERPSSPLLLQKLMGLVKN